MLRRLASWAMIGGALLYWQKKREQSAYGRSPAKPTIEEKTRWEAEGGALPRTGAQLGPDPAVSAVSVAQPERAKVMSGTPNF
jgi:hypothetical protein